MSIGSLPRHVAIIMDGNRRWAARRGLPILAGHREGTRALKRMVRECARLGIEELTVYSFSTENWSRPPREVDALMDLFCEVLDTEIAELHKQGVRVRFLGRRGELSSSLQERMLRAELLTEPNTVLTLNVAFNYGGRAEIVDAVRRLVDDGLTPEHVTERAIADRLYIPGMSDPDLVIRTSGEYRLSNFLLWETAYSELYVSSLFWPEFDEEALREALKEYGLRERRFGGHRAEDLA
jgi:undecaprenyl diphosphate synthase